MKSLKDELTRLKPVIKTTEKPKPAAPKKEVVKLKTEKVKAFHWEPASGLPVSKKAREIIEVIQKHRVFILTGETGSGKSTQLPKLCVLAGRGKKAKIAHTQPRRIAAISLANRVSEEIGSPVGEAIGYQVRFHEEISRANRVRFMTDGILLAQTQTDALLKAYDTIIIDEAHERSLNIDFLLGYLKTLLKRRDDLKVIVTSATIDAERFAQHFADEKGNPAPIISVSGRTYPVEIRYRPIEETDDDENAMMDAIDDAVSELVRERSGDILVFLPGEAEIRTVAERLTATQPSHLEILPLYARLSVANQARVFHPSGARRIILSTNVAETSVTVPGIRFVVDPGLARVKRYSYRMKVDRLLVEPVSRAACDQRAGRCGRVADGICIRLFSEDDYLKRAVFTDPEILRTNLAGVILRMKNLRLGDIRTFDFVQKPPMRAIADGISLLSELGALDSEESLTETGRQMAQFPLDPKVSRMLLEANRRGCLREVLIIASALSVEEPRERPVDAAEAADAAHKAFADEKSDFIAFLNLWRWYEKAYAKRETNKKFATELKRRFLSAKRMREWRDVHRELSEVVADFHWQANDTASSFEEIHISLLSGLLGRVGQKIIDAEPKAPPYAGGHGVKFFIWPGSSQAKKANRWVMADELVETSRLFARTVAAIDPKWIEVVGSHLIRKTYSEPHWEKKPASVMALERGTLYGLTVYAGRKVNYSAIDPAVSRELLIRQGLVEGEFETRGAFFTHNRKLIEQIEALEHKARRFDYLVDDETIFGFYDEIIPETVANGAAFEAWRKNAEKENPKILFLTKEKLMRREASGITYELYPKALTIAGNRMALSYHFEPGSPKDGVTLALPLAAIATVNEKSLSWLVPGMIREKVAALLKSLPQRYRRNFVPVEDYATGFMKRHGKDFGVRDLIAVLIEDIFEEKAIRVTESDFKTENLAKHLFMNYKIVDESGRQLDMGRNLAELKARLADEIRKSYETVTVTDDAGEELAEEITDWSFGDLPEIMEVRRRNVTMIGYPALVDRGKFCTIEVFDEKAAADAAHLTGLVRLIMLALPEQMKYARKNLRELQDAYLKMLDIPILGKCFTDFEALVDETLTLTITQSALTGELPVNAEAFQKTLDTVRSKLNLIATDVAQLIKSIVAEAQNASRALKTVKDADVVKDVTEEFSWLFASQFLTQTPLTNLRHYPRYLKAVSVRLEKLRENREEDAKKMFEVKRFVTLYEREIALRKGFTDTKLEDFRWMVEELRVSLFAQRLKTPFPVSVKRLDKVWQSIKYGA